MHPQVRSKKQEARSKKQKARRRPQVQRDPFWLLASDNRQ
jgi:hypothetical protein